MMPKVEFKFSDGTPKKMRRSVRFEEAIAKTRGTVYRVSSKKVAAKVVAPAD